MINERIDRLFSLMEKTGMRAAAFNPGPTLVYLTGLHFHLSERPTTLLVSPPAAPAIIVPELEVGKAEGAFITLQIFPFGENPVEWKETFRDAARALNLEGKKVAIEPTRMRYLEMRCLQQALPGIQFASGEAVLSRLRMQKDPQEIRAIREAVRIAQEALRATLPQVHPGVSERDLAAELVMQLLSHGSDSILPFQPIVAGGVNSANPHAIPGEYRLRTGDLLLFDWGASHNGYFSDITRTFAIGEINPELRAIYNLVLQANTVGRAAGKPGLPAGQLDHAARSVIERGGYGAYFTHRTGHGLGMESHEPPYLFAENNFLLAEGMVYTVEPGIYLPGKGGVRIEDVMVATQGSSQTLTDLPRELTTL